METEQAGANQPAAAGANREPLTAARPGPDSQAKPSRWLDWRVALALVIAVVILCVATFWKGSNHAAANADVLMTVAVAKADREDLFTELTRDAEFRPYVEVELHAKVSGYVDQMNVDF